MIYSKDKIVFWKGTFTGENGAVFNCEEARFTEIVDFYYIDDIAVAYVADGYGSIFRDEDINTDLTPKD